MAKSVKKAAILKKAIAKCSTKGKKMDNEKDNGKKETAAHEKSESAAVEKAEGPSMSAKFGNLFKAVKK